MSNSSMSFFNVASTALQFPNDGLTHIEMRKTGELTSPFPVADFAAEVIGVAGASVGHLLNILYGSPVELTVDKRLASFWFGWSIRPIGWDMPAAWDSIAGDYRTKDGWIRLHTNAPHHKVAALKVLQCANDRHSVAGATAGWSANALETAIVSRNGCAATMRTCQDWMSHPQGKAVASEPLITMSTVNTSTKTSSWAPTKTKPLSGLRVLDLTRVLAGPVATRFLAGYGANVLRIDPPGWEEPALVPEVTLGKRCARLDLENQLERHIFEDLLAEADVLVHGYRPGALDGLGYSEATRRTINPHLIDVSLNAYGWTGPWRDRRGFDSLIQMSSGIAHRGMLWNQAEHPVPLPVQAIDQSTGYLMAATVVRSLIRRMVENQATTAKLSLARTAQALIDMPDTGNLASCSPLNSSDFAISPETTFWGAALRCDSPILVNGQGFSWSYPAGPLGFAKPVW